MASLIVTNGGELWIQQLFKTGRAKLVKIAGKLNPADLYTKYLSRAEIIYHMSFLGFKLLDGAGNVAGDKDLNLEMQEDYLEEEPGE